jgi:hypothetical protein
VLLAIHDLHREHALIFKPMLIIAVLLAMYALHHILVVLLVHAVLHLLCNFLTLFVFLIGVVIVPRMITLPHLVYQ